MKDTLAKNVITGLGTWLQNRVLHVKDRNFCERTGGNPDVAKVQNRVLVQVCQVLIQQLQSGRQRVQVSLRALHLVTIRQPRDRAPHPLCHHKTQAHCIVRIQQ